MSISIECLAYFVDNKIPKVKEEEKSALPRSNDLKMSRNITSESKATDVTRSVYAYNNETMKPTKIQIYWKDSALTSGVRIP